MSNIIIGFIAIALFIGLSIAGAVIVSDEFRSSRATAAAAGISSQLQQTVAGINMHRLKTGRAIGSDFGRGMAELSPRFLKAPPSNPYGGDTYLFDAHGEQGDSSPATMVAMDLGSTPSASAACRQLEEQAGAADPDAALLPAAGWAPSNRLGCMNVDGNFYAYMPI